MTGINLRLQGIVLVLLVLAVLVSSAEAAGAPDTTPPTVVSTDPADGATGVPVDVGKITITFSENVHFTGSGTSSFRLVDANNEGVSAFTEFPQHDTKGYITPHEPLALGTQYTIEVSGAEDEAGIVMVGEYIGHFTVIGNDVPIPEFPSAFLPAAMIIGFLGAVLLIQRTREQ